MRTPLITAICAAAWLIGGNPAIADEAGSAKTNAPQTNATSSATETPDDSIFEPGPSPQRLRGGGNVEWRRNDHPNAGQNNGGGRANNRGGSGGGGSDSGGGGGGSSD